MSSARRRSGPVAPGSSGDRDSATWRLPADVEERRRDQGLRAGLAAHDPSACLRAVTSAQEENHQPHSTVSSFSMYSCGVGTKPFTFLLNIWMLLALQ